MSSERVDWVEIIEPKTKEHMYANLTTGECVWDPPEGVNVKRTDSSQWWELFDNNTHRFYYYNATTQTTVWHRPVDCDIIPLAKLQTLKQNTDPQQRRETATQTNAGSQASVVPDSVGVGAVSNGVSSSVSSGGGGGSSKVSPLGHKTVAHTQTSPMHARRTHHHSSSRCGAEGRRSRGSSGVSGNAAGVGVSGVCRHTDSGRSSDSSISSAAQPYRRLQESGLASSVSSHHKPESRVSSDAGSLSRSAGGVRVAETGPVSIGLPASCSTPQLRKKTSSQSQPSPHTAHPPIPEPGLNRSGNFMSPRKDASDDSMHEKYFKSVDSTPLSRRKTKQTAAGTGATSSCESSPHSPASPLQTPHMQVPSRPSLVSSISLATDHSPHPLLTAPPTVASGPPAVLPQQQSLDRAAHRHRDRHQYHLDRTARERFSDRHIDKDRIDDRLLERNLDRSYPSDKGAMYSVDKGFKQSSFDQRQSGWTPKEITRKQQAEPERHTGVKVGSSSKQCSTPDSHSSKSSYHLQDAHPTPAGIGYGVKSLSLDPPLTKPNIDRHNMEMEREREKERERDREREREKERERHKEIRNKERDRDRLINENTGTEPRREKGPRKQKVATTTNMDTLESESGCENGNTSPLYSNWDLHMQHLLPLQHYILEQAKLSGCYRVGDPLGPGSGDSDSLHSSGSSSGARSLSGHEPDNEDSDRSGSNDTYLQHQPPPAPPAITHGEDEYMNYSVSYYNTFVGFEKEREPVVGVHRSASGTGMGYPSGGGIGYPGGVAFSAGGMGPPQPPPTYTMPCEALYSPVKSHATTLHTNETDIEKFAQDNLNLHSKGIFRKKASVRDMLSWTSGGISGPMLGDRRDKAYKKASAELFRLVQIYMGDRKARPGMTLNSVAMNILHAAFSNPALRDELYVQLCRQTTENPQRDSLLRGWELLAVSLAFVPPSPAFQPPLLNYMNRHRDPAFADFFREVCKWPIHVQVSHYASVACRRLERIGQCGKRQPRKPTTEDIDQARIHIFRQSMFGNTLDEVMELQKPVFPNRQLPWVQVALSQQILAMQGKQTEGIFRVSADVDEVNALKNKLDVWELPDQSQITDAHAPASLLKLWYRELYEPLIPDTLYAECVSDPDNTDKAFEIVQRLPRLNRLVLTYLVGFLQQFSTPDVVMQTKMDSANLAMVFAPNCLRCTSQDPRIILENARKEMTFMRCLILNMDTTQVRDML